MHFRPTPILANSNWLTCAFVIAVFPILSGCGESVADRVAAMNETKLQKLYNVYKLYSQSNAYKGPKSKEELTEFLLIERYKKNLERMQIDRSSLDDLFINDRDGKPFKIRWGVNGFGDKAIVFEEEGVDGKRFVALQEPREVDAEEYEAYWSGKKKPKEPTLDQGPPQ